MKLKSTDYIQLRTESIYGQLLFKESVADGKRETERETEMDGVQQSAALEKTATETDSLEQGTNILKLINRFNLKYIRQFQKLFFTE